jgi:hypothetical protein
LPAVVAIRKRYRSAFWRNPTANTACGRVLRTQHSFPAAYDRRDDFFMTFVILRG